MPKKDIPAGRVGNSSKDQPKAIDALEALVDAELINLLRSSRDCRACAGLRPLLVNVSAFLAEVQK